ncbi:MAG: 50S ribosomal protein L11 [Candidatus Aenigmarchaeota archaeon]|nr:50S ribosomal protein L11 [Candidatus Aenigmarchaeota archaeon]
MEKVEILVEGGKATPAPPIGPTLSPMGVNVSEVVKEINEKTKSFAGMQVPVKIMIDTATKKFTISVGSPPVSALIKKELKVQKLATVAEDKKRNMAGSISFEAVVNIAKGKDSIKGPLSSKVKQVLGTCLSGGVLVEDKDPREIIKEINEGKRKVE